MVGNYCCKRSRAKVVHEGEIIVPTAVELVSTFELTPTSTDVSAVGLSGSPTAVDLSGPPAAAAVAQKAFVV